jgi:hypothetical protein
MAARKSSEENFLQRRAEMVAMHKRGCSYGMIARKFGVSKNTARAVVLRALGKLELQRLQATATPLSVHAV